MATNKPLHRLGSPQQHIPMCNEHNYFLDIQCEDCDLFICSSCAKTDHKEHNWVTNATAASKRRKDIVQYRYLETIKEVNLSGIDEKIDEALARIKENENHCDLQVQKLRKHYDEIIMRLIELKNFQEKQLKDNMIQKNKQMNLMKSELEKHKKDILELVEFLDENNSTMSDYSLVDNHRELNKRLSDVRVDMKIGKMSVSYNTGKISEEILKSLIGQVLNLDDIYSATETNSFMCGGNGIQRLKAFSEETCFITNYKERYLEEVDRHGERKLKSIKPNDICLTGAGSIYFTQYETKSINRLSPSGSVSVVATTHPFSPYDLCQTVEGNLLVTLHDMDEDGLELGVVRHMTLTGQVIRDYEYNEDLSRSFAEPTTVTQNRKTDIGVIDCKGEFSTELVIFDLSGHVKFVHRGGCSEKDSVLYPADFVFDSLCNIIVSDINRWCIQLLSPDGKFLKILLTAKETNSSLNLSLFGSTLWVGNSSGLVKVFQYKNDNAVNLCH
ncbi:uncharacterized protein LOC134281307 [Saccostrea cucullata]|uniref:uncharacterized protein LOC134281307 n=1 Tax=Saccostrea cuccullata TaxID=36930 RepID=UPI002ED2D9BE